MKQKFRTSIFTALLTAIIKLPFLPLIIYWKLLKKQTLATIIFTISTIIIGISIFHYTIIRTLPAIETIYEYKPKLSSKIYDRNDNLIFEIGAEKRVYVKINEIPPMLIKAFLAAEDKAFYEHKGVDLISLSKIMLLNIVKIAKHEKIAGASTITQQIVRNILLTNERTITRKIKEFILSYQISKELTKDQILELYLNHIYLGLQSYGVVSAANNYFGKTLEQLTIAEMATLASMPKAPSAMNRKHNKNKLIIRRNWILGEMLRTNFITQEEYNQNIIKDIIIQHKENSFYPFYAPATFAKNIITNSDLNIDEIQIAEKGYKIQLTIDSQIQKVAQQALEKTIIAYTKDHGYNGAIENVNLLKDYKFNDIMKSVNIKDEYDENYQIALVTKVENNFINIQLAENTFGKITLEDMKWARKKISETELGPIIKKCQDVLKEGDIIFTSHKGGSFYTLEETPTINGGVIILDSKNNNILAMAGGYKDQAGGFNRAVQAFRQLGSAAKPFVYATALEEGVQVNSIFMDSEISITGASNIKNGS